MSRLSDARIGAFLYTERGAGDAVIERLARELQSRGVRLAGVIQLAPEPGDAACDMTVELLDTSARQMISERRGKESKGCRLDNGALEGVAGQVAAALSAGAQMLVLSKFSKTEAEGRGLRQVIEQAMLADIPVLTSVPAPYLAAFETFAEGLALVSADEREIEAWVGNAL